MKMKLPRKRHNHKHNFTTNTAWGDPRQIPVVAHRSKNIFSLMLKVYPITKICYSNILKTFTTKNENFYIKHTNILRISARNIDCRYPLEPPRRGGSNAYPQYMFLSRNKKTVYPCKPQVHYTKSGFSG